MCVCVSICHISCPLYILLFRPHAIIIRCSNNYLEIATFNIKPSPRAYQQPLTLTLMTVGRYYPAHTHFELVPKGYATDPSILCENKTNFPYHKLPYVFYYDKMVCGHCHFLFFNLPFAPHQVFILGKSALI